MRQFLAVTFVLGLLLVPTAWFLDPGSVEGVVAAVARTPEPVAARPLMSEDDKRRARAVAARKDTEAGAHAIVDGMGAIAAGLSGSLSHAEGEGASPEVREARTIEIEVGPVAAASEPDPLETLPSIRGGGGDGAVASLVGELPAGMAKAAEAEADIATPSQVSTARPASAASAPAVTVILRNRPIAVTDAGPGWLSRVYSTAISWYDLV